MSGNIMETFYNKDETRSSNITIPTLKAKKQNLMYSGKKLKCQQSTAHLEPVNVFLQEQQTLIGDFCCLTSMNEFIARNMRKNDRGWFTSQAKNKYAKLNLKNNQIRSLSRTSNQLRRLMQANFNPHKDLFVTLTFKENISSIKEAKRLFRNFNRRLKNYWKKNNNSELNFKYLCIPEKQKKRNCWHFHVLMHGDAKFWGNEKKAKEIISDVWIDGLCDVRNIYYVYGLYQYLAKDIIFDLLKLSMMNFSDNPILLIKMSDWMDLEKCRYMDGLLSSCYLEVIPNLSVLRMVQTKERRYYASKSIEYPTVMKNVSANDFNKWISKLNSKQIDKRTFKNRFNGITEWTVYQVVRDKIDIFEK